MSTLTGCRMQSVRVSAVECQDSISKVSTNLEPFSAFCLPWLRWVSILGHCYCCLGQLYCMSHSFGLKVIKIPPLLHYKVVIRPKNCGYGQTQGRGIITKLPRCKSGVRIQFMILFTMVLGITVCTNLSNSCLVMYGHAVGIWFVWGLWECARCSISTDAHLRPRSLFTCTSWQVLEPTLV